MDTAVDFAFEQTSGFEHAQVLGNSRQGKRKWLGKLRDGGFAIS